MELPLITVLIPVRNEAATIERCLDSVLGGSVAPDQVLVIDGMSTDRTVEIVRRYEVEHPTVRLLANPARTVPAALNVGWREAAGDLIVRIDGHGAVSYDYLELVRQHLTSGEWQGVGGRKVPEARTPTGRVIAAAMESRWGVGNSRYHYSMTAEEAEHVPFGAYQREIVEKLGGWDEDLLVNQDFEFDYRLRQLGGKILFDPNLVSRWSCSSSLGDLIHQYHRYGRGKAKVALKHPRSMRLRHLLPPLLPVGLVAMCMAVLLRRSRLGALGLGTYAAGMAATAFVGRAAKLPVEERVRFPLAIVSMHNAWGIGFLRGLIDRLRSEAAGDPYRHRRLELDEDPPRRGDPTA